MKQGNLGSKVMVLFLLEFSCLTHILGQGNLGSIWVLGDTGNSFSVGLSKARRIWVVPGNG